MRRTLLPVHLVSAVLLFCASVALAVDPCAYCGGKITHVGAITDDRAQPSKNLAVWNRSICANPFYGEDSLICTKCWLSFSKDFGYWERKSNQPDSFHRALTPEIRNFPAPSPGGVYAQYQKDGRCWESAMFWCTRSDKLASTFRDYARKHGLSINIDPRPDVKQMIVTVRTKS
ncbi:MAG TPA: hypothetical protein VLE43_03985 [Candidatus Saccharimonadia bacterium]|nr:hypothetical protein [Candidatus Saccharimonadia bacterium]